MLEKAPRTKPNHHARWHAPPRSAFHGLPEREPWPQTLRRRRERDLDLDAIVVPILVAVGLVAFIVRLVALVMSM